MTDFIVQLAVQATKIIVPIIIVLGTVSNSLNILILTRRTLIHHTCSVYFIFLAASNLFCSTVMLTINMLADGYQLNLSVYSNFSCKLIAYLLVLCPDISVYLIVLASIDRYCASSINVRIRNFSSMRVARWNIGVLILILTIFSSWIFVLVDLEQDDVSVCVVESTSLSGQLFSIIDVTFYLIIAPFCMILFGCLTIKNANAFRLSRGGTSRLRRTERQLSRMLLLQVGTHIILTLPLCIVCILSFSTSLRFTFNFYYILIICKLPFYLTFTTSFFLYILSAQIYRNELLRLFNKIFPIRRINRIHATIKPNPVLMINRAFVNH